MNWEFEQLIYSAWKWITNWKSITKYFFIHQWFQKYIYNIKVAVLGSGTLNSFISLCKFYYDGFIIVSTRYLKLMYSNNWSNHFCQAIFSLRIGHWSFGLLHIRPGKRPWTSSVLEPVLLKQELDRYTNRFLFSQKDIALKVYIFRLKSKNLLLLRSILVLR